MDIGQAQSRTDDTPRTLDIVLDPPVVFNNRTITELHLEEPTGDQVERAEAELAQNVSIHSMRKYQIALVSLCSGEPRQAVGKMRISQIKEAADFLSGFISGGQATGETSSPT